MNAGDILYKKASGYAIVYSKTEGDEVFGFVRAPNGRQWEEQPVVSILSKGYWEAVAEVVEKHGTHDQSTHNPWKGGKRGFDPMRGYTAGQWTKETDPAKIEEAFIEQSLAAMEQREGRALTPEEKNEFRFVLKNNEAVTAVRKEQLKDAEVYMNGSTMIIVKRDVHPVGVTVTDENIRGLSVEIDRMQRDYPVAGLRVHVDDKAFDDAVRDPRTAMFAYRGGATSPVEPHIFIKTVSMKNRPARYNGMYPYFTPDPNEVTLGVRRVQLTHEWGHLMDDKAKLPYELKDMKIQEVVDRVDAVWKPQGKPALAMMTPYGSTANPELFAETFAQYVIYKQKGWKLENPLTLEMAKEFKW